jgi:ubiquinone/menaquinone biosynthesis C-methylase UbiE
MIARMHKSLLLLTVLLIHTALVPTGSYGRNERRDLAEPSDDSWRRPDLVLEALDAKPGEAIADLGAGSGYYSGPLANMVGRRGTVYATDIDDNALNGLERLKATHHFTQMVIIRGAHQSTGLPPNSVDAVLISHTLREVKQPEQFLSSLKPALKRNARIVIAELQRRDDGFAPPKSSRIAIADAKRIVQRAGYRITDVKEITRQYILTCQAN